MIDIDADRHDLTTDGADVRRYLSKHGHGIVFVSAGPFVRCDHEDGFAAARAAVGSLD